MPFGKLKTAVAGITAGSTVRRKPGRLLSWAPPALVDPIVVEYRNAGPYDVTNSVQRADSYTFPTDRDLRVTLAAGGVSRSNGVVINGGRNITLIGGVINVAADYAAAAGLSHGAPDYGLNTKNKALLINKTTDGTVHIEGVRFTGDWLYECLDLRGTTGCHLQWENCQVDTVRYHSEKTAGAAYDHDGGDVLQTQSNWGEIRVDGLRVRGSRFQGLFMKQESGRTVGAATLRNVYLDAYAGPGAAIYVSNPAQVAEMTNVFIRPTAYYSNDGTNPPAPTGAVKTAATTQYVGSTVVDLGAKNGPSKVRVLLARPGDGYVTPGYMPS